MAAAAAKVENGQKDPCIWKPTPGAPKSVVLAAFPGSYSAECCVCMDEEGPLINVCLAGCVCCVQCLRECMRTELKEGDLCRMMTCGCNRPVSYMDIGHLQDRVVKLSDHKEKLFSDEVKDILYREGQRVAQTGRAKYMIDVYRKIDNYQLEVPKDLLHRLGLEDAYSNEELKEHGLRLVHIIDKRDDVKTNPVYLALCGEEPRLGNYYWHVRYFYTSIIKKMTRIDFWKNFSLEELKAMSYTAGTWPAEWKMSFYESITDLIIDKETSARFKKILPDGAYACPTEECTGVARPDGVCPVCAKQSCPECREQCGENHACDEEKLQTIKAVFETCTFCPQCSTPIEREYGCYQMICTKEGCGCVFEYVKGKQGIPCPPGENVHNTHYQEFFRQRRARTGEQQKEQGCRAMEWSHFVSSPLTTSLGLTPYTGTMVSFTHHIRNVFRLELWLRDVNGYQRDTHFEERVLFTQVKPLKGNETTEERLYRTSYTCARSTFCGIQYAITGIMLSDVIRESFYAINKRCAPFVNVDAKGSPETRDIWKTMFDIVSDEIIPRLVKIRKIGGYQVPEQIMQTIVHLNHLFYVAALPPIVIPKL